MANFGHDQTKNLVDLDQWIKESGQGTSSDITELKNRLDNIWSVIYPVGSIYISTNSTNPAAIFGGSWEAYAQGRCIFGVGGTGTAFNTVGKTGGSEYLQSHDHKFTAVMDNRNGSTGASNVWGVTNVTVSRNVGESESAKTYLDAMSGKADRITIDGFTSSAGTGSSGNLPPYITCYIWRRVE